MDRATSAGYLAFPDFHTAALWYALWGRPHPDTSGTGDPDDPTESEGESDGEAQPTEQGDDGAADSDSEAAEGEEEDGAEADPVERDDQPTAGPDTEHDPDSSDKGVDDDYDSGWSGYGDPVEAEETKREFELTEPAEHQPAYPFYHKIEDEDGNVQIIREFPSWYEFVTCVRDTPCGWTGKKIASRKPDSTFFGTKSFDEAIDMALNRGWPEGRELLTDLIAQVAPRPQAVETWNYDIAGSFPSIPMFCAGDPACMVSEINPEQRNARPIVRIDMSIAANWTIKQKTFMTRGAAMLSFAQNLENYGYSTELRIISTTREGRFTVKTSVVFKEAGQLLDIDRAAFAIAHPSTLRRLIFALYEQHKEIEQDYEGNYGIPVHEPVDPASGKPGGAIFIPGPQSNNETTETAKRIIEQAARDAGFVDETFAQDQAA